MAHIKRKYIDKHWFVFILRGGIAVVLGCLLLFGGLINLRDINIMISVFLLVMGAVDALGALYNASKKRGWVNSVFDAIVDIMAALAILIFSKDALVTTLIIIAVYTLVSGIIDIFHAFLSTVDPTDRFIRIIAGGAGCIIGFAILNSGPLELMAFMRFFGSYMLIVGIASLIYGVHNRSQNIEDKIARREVVRKPNKKNK